MHDHNDFSRFQKTGMDSMDLFLCNMYNKISQFSIVGNILGAKIDIQDNFGRAPLHVAAAVDYAEMVEFLINKNANINISTLTEEQTPIHFAAKNGACQSLKMLLAYGADIVSKDSKNRTPLQV